MTDDLVKRLRADLASGLSASIGDTKEAADEIEWLLTILRLLIAYEDHDADLVDGAGLWERVISFARHALGEKKDV